MSIREAVQQYSDALQSLNFGEHHTPIEGLLLAKGEVFEAGTCPKHIKRGTPKHCFCNATRLAWGGIGKYYEGVVMSKQLPFPIHHAWVVENGKVIDNTLREPDQYEYLGVWISTPMLNETLRETGVYGVLDCGRGANIKLIEKLHQELPCTTTTTTKE